MGKSHQKLGKSHQKLATECDGNAEHRLVDEWSIRVLLMYSLLAVSVIKNSLLDRESSF